ncbi:hypothetical protein [Pseudoalteromonas sp. T1lg88]|uniref:hypothetical protein n=1 Tax=Pseudoalteromonas sp. T1lg88 TaxID=2077104 RepID=UPI000CF74689|nr:hypothetical protein [Pseudoalteromonas sp. T1lg88]
MIVPPTVIAQLPQVIGKIIPLFTNAIKVLSTKLPLLIDKIKPITDTIWKASQAMEVYKSTASAEKLGDKVIQAEQQGVTLESCMGDYKAYQNKIDNFNLDADKSLIIPVEEKLSASLVLMTIELEERYGPEIVGIFGLINRNSDFFSSDRISKYLEACDQAYISISDICSYFNSNLNRQDSNLVEKKLIEIEKSIKSDINEGNIVSSIRLERE